MFYILYYGKVMLRYKNIQENCFSFFYILDLLLDEVGGMLVWGGWVRIGKDI